ncbi:MAG: aldo/keto reductase [Spirochaetes bacterium]|nr:aldo/keto reductase [Spirochaetota bacterium]
MLYRKMPKSKDNLSILGFGCMRLPGNGMNVDEKEAIKQLRFAIDQGVNYLDTAWPYHNGKSEEILGKAIKDGYREKVKIADKLPHWLCKSREDMDYYLNTQLERLNEKVIDYYLIHALDYQAWQKAKSIGVVDFLKKANEQGKIINIGFSFHGPKGDFKKIIDEYDWDFCQIQFNILDEHFQAGVEGLDYAYSKGIGVIIMEPLRGGSLAGQLPDAVEKIYQSAPQQRTNVEWALRWVWNHPGVVSVLSGMNNLVHIEENIKTAHKAMPESLSQEELAIIKAAADCFRSLMKVPCTGCQYCMPCPKNVDIPSSFTFYNNKYLFKQGFMSRSFYLLQLGDLQEGKPALASQCIDCGKCVKHCPQNINIPVELKKVKKDFEGKFTTKPLLFLMKTMLSQGEKKK